jgi:hypothetical protein
MPKDEKPGGGLLYVVKIFCEAEGMQIIEHINGCVECQQRFKTLIGTLRDEVPAFDFLIQRILPKFIKGK